MSDVDAARAVEAVHGKVDGVPMWTTFPGIWKPGEMMGLHAFGYWSALISVMLLPMLLIGTLANGDDTCASCGGKRLAQRVDVCCAAVENTLPA